MLNTRERHRAIYTQGREVKTPGKGEQEDRQQVDPVMEGQD